MHGALSEDIFNCETLWHYQRLIFENLFKFFCDIVKINLELNFDQKLSNLFGGFNSKKKGKHIKLICYHKSFIGDHQQNKKN